MNGIEYQMAAMRTNDGRNRDRLLNAVSTTNGTGVAELLNGVIGESGEVADLVKKGVFHEKGIDIDHLKKECGDVMWYVAMICDASGFTLDDVMQTNKEKLENRYPDGFDTWRANHKQEGDI